MSPTVGCRQALLLAASMLGQCLELQVPRGSVKANARTAPVPPPHSTCLTFATWPTSCCWHTCGPRRGATCSARCVPCIFAESHVRQGARCAASADSHNSAPAGVSDGHTLQPVVPPLRRSRLPSTLAPCPGASWPSETPWCCTHLTRWGIPLRRGTGGGTGCFSSCHSGNETF